MKTITFNAHRGNSTLSLLIRLASRGIYNHISIELNGFIYEAHVGKGVIKTPFKKWNDLTVAESETINITPKNYKIVKAFLEAQVGKKYDIRGIFAFLFIFARPRIGYWYCSELAKVALCHAIGYKNNADTYAQTESPHSFWINFLLIKSLLK